MRRTSRDPVRRLRATVARLPRHTREAMLRGIDSNRIIVGAYVDPRSGGICPMLAAHRNGGRTSVASFARAWDEFTDARRPRRATRREVRTLRTLLEASLGPEGELEQVSIAELAAQIRAERSQRAGCVTVPIQPASESQPRPPEPPGATIRIRRRQPRRDLLAAAERELSGDPSGR